MSKTLPKIFLRLVLDVLVLAAVFMLPWWLSIVFLIVVAASIPFFFEFLILGGILGVLVIQATGVNPFIPIATIALLFIIIEYLKKYLIFYDYE
jgi:hypothetical protein